MVCFLSNWLKNYYFYSQLGIFMELFGLSETASHQEKSQIHRS